MTRDEDIDTGKLRYKDKRIAFYNKRTEGISLGLQCGLGLDAIKTDLLKTLQ